MPTTKTHAAVENAADNLVAFNQDAFRTVLDMQMRFLETATQFAREFTSFAAHRAEANVEDFAKLAGAKSPPDLLRMQLDHMRTMFEDYSKEANRLIAITGDALKKAS